MDRHAHEDSSGYRRPDGIAETLLDLGLGRPKRTVTAESYLFCKVVENSGRADRGGTQGVKRKRSKVPIVRRSRDIHRYM